MAAGESLELLPVGVNYRESRAREDTSGEFKGLQLGRQFATSQWLVLAVVLAVGFGTEPLWGLVVPPVVGYVLTPPVAFALAVLSVLLRIEGRTPIQVMTGVWAALLAPRDGRIDGQPVRYRRPCQAGGRYWVSDSFSDSVWFGG